MAYLEEKLVSLFAPRSPFIAVDIERVGDVDKDDESTTYRFLGKEAGGVVITGVKRVADLLVALGLGSSEALEKTFRETYCLKDGVTIDEEKIRANASSEEAFQGGLASVKNQLAVFEYHKSRIRAREEWAANTKIAIPYKEYHALCGIAQRVTLRSKDLATLLETMVTHLSRVAEEVKKDIGPDSDEK
jgi:hypothetical protein